MKYDFETIIDRDPAIRGTGKYRIMKDSKGNKPPKGIVPLSVADMEFRTAPCVIDAIKAEADENPSRLGRSARLDRPLRAGRSRPL